MVDASVNGAILSNTYNEAYEIINAQLALVTNILQTLALGQGSMTKAPVQIVVIMTQATVESCVYCGHEQTFGQCLSNPTSIFYVRNQANSSILTTKCGEPSKLLMEGIKRVPSTKSAKVNYFPSFGL